MSQTVFKPAKFLELAEKLIIDNRYEETTRFRVVVGRSYYAAFLRARIRLQELGQSFNRTSSEHRQVINGLTQRNPHLGDMLSTLFDKRVDADYRMHTRIDKVVGNSCIQLARQIIRDLSALR